MEILKDSYTDILTHFKHFNKESVKDCCTNENIKQYIKMAIDYFRENKDKRDWGGWITGNLYIHVHRYSENGVYTIYVSNDFYKTEIPFEKEDFKRI